MNIKEIRTKLKLTQKDFANLIGKSVASLKNYESGKTEPGKDVMAKISELANVSKEWLEGEAGDAAVAAVGAMEKTKEVAEGVSDAATVAEIEVKKTVRKGGRKAKEVAEDLAVKTEDVADSFTANEIEAKKTVRKGGRKAKKAAAADKANEVIEPVKEATEPIVEAAKEAAEKITEKVTKKASKKTKKSAPILTIEAQMGGQITVDDILKRIPEGVTRVYIKPEENKAYWVKGDESGEVDLWE